MPYYSESGPSGTPSGSAYSSIFLNGPYSNHSSIIASNILPPSFSKPIPRQYRGGYKPHLSTISELNSPLRRINSPKLYGNTSNISIRPIKKINTADIDVSVNRYRKFEKYEKPKVYEPEKDKKPLEKTPSPKRLSESPKKSSPINEIDSLEQKEAKPNPTIRRDRTTIRLSTVHKDTLQKKLGAIKSWRDNFKPEELVTESKRIRKTPGEILKEKFLIKSRSKENILKGVESKRLSKKGGSIKKSPSFHDICQAISNDTIDEALNPGQPLEVQRKQSRQFSNESFIKELRRNSTDLSEEDFDLLDAIIHQQNQLALEKSKEMYDETEKDNGKNECNAYESRESVRKKKKIVKNKINKNNTSSNVANIDNTTPVREDNVKDENLTGQEQIVESKSPLQRKPVKKVKSIIKEESQEFPDKIYQNVIRDISQVEIEQKTFKLRPVITGTVGSIKEPKRTLKAVVDDVEVNESPKFNKKEKKFRFNVFVEVENEDASKSLLSKQNEICDKPRRRPSTKVGKNGGNRLMYCEGVVQIPQAKEVVISSILKKRPQVQSFTILEEEKETSQKQSISKNEHLVKEKNVQVQTNYANGITEKPETKQDNQSNANSIVNKVEDALAFTKKKSLTKQLSDPNFVKPEAKFKEKTNENISLPSTPIFNTGEPNEQTYNIKNNNFTEGKIKLPLKTMEYKKEKNINKPITSLLLKDENKIGTENKLDQIESKTKPTDKTPILFLSKNKPKSHSTSPLDDTTKLFDNQLNETKSKAESTPPNSSLKRTPSLLENKLNKTKSKAELTPPTSPLRKTHNLLENRESLTKSDSELTPSTLIIKKTPVSLHERETSTEKDNLKENILGDKNSTDNISKTAKENISDVPDTKEVNHDFDADCESKLTEKENNAEDTKKKLMSKRSLIQKANVDDPDLVVFVPPPEPEPEPEPQPEADVFVPLQSNRLSQWMHPWKKPEQFEECPIEIFARPKVIRGRHYPRPRGHHAQPPQPEAAESESSDEEETSETETETETSSSSSGEDEEELVDKIGASTSSNDSGFGSGAPAKNKGSLESRDSPVSNNANNSAFALDSGDIPEEYSQSSTFTEFQKSGRITPPATTIPRFRKYCVDDFNFLKVLGKGSFGKVLLAELKGTEYYYAVKCLKKDVVLEDDDVECTLIERKVLALGTKHPYLCHLLCTFQTESHLFFVMEYLNGGDLMFHIQSSGRFPEHQARFYGAEIVSGLKFLHNKGIVYRDLKLDNVLLDFDGHVRIADFGMCKLQIFLDRMAETFCGTPDYMAPEIIKGQHYNQSVDWWSFGVLLYEMLLGQSPFSGCDEDELFWSICNEKPVLPRYLSTEATNVLTMFLEKDASKRLGNRFCTHGDIQDQPFFRPIDWNALESRALEAPFKPNLRHPLDTQYFDKHFTVENAKLTPIDQTILQSMDQAQFQGFSYTNPNATDR